MGTVSHPNIIKIYGVMTLEGKIIIIDKKYWDDRYYSISII